MLERLDRGLSLLSHGLDWVVIRVVVVLVVALLVTITIQVVARVVFDALPWTEELSRYLLVWSTFFGATLAYYRRKHIQVRFVQDLLEQWLGANTGRSLRMLEHCLCIVFFLVVIVQGQELIGRQIYQVSPGLGLPMATVYIALPAGALVMILHAFHFLVRELKPATPRAQEEGES